MRVFLTGFMAAGKTTVGRELARLLNAEFVDLDDAIVEAAGKSVSRIFEESGEEEFRRLERETLVSVMARAVDPLVVATGGGAMEATHNRRLMRQAGVIVWLDVPFEVLSSRLATGSAERPKYGDEEHARRLYRRRRRFYARADHQVVIEPDMEPEEAASKILARLERNECDT